jgi:hypothetical protein
LGSVSGTNDSGYVSNLIVTTVSVVIPISGIVANGDYFFNLSHRIVETAGYDIYNPNVVYGSAQAYTVGQITGFTVFEITNLTGTTQAQWNTFAGTSGVVYAVGSWFFNAVAGTGLGTGGIKTWSGRIIINYNIYGYLDPITYQASDNTYQAYVIPYNGGVTLYWPARIATTYARHNQRIYYNLNIYKY